MKKLEQRVAATRAGIRRAVSRIGITDPRRIRPVRLVIRLHDPLLDPTRRPSAGVVRPPLPLATWRELLVSAIDWLGPVELTLMAGSHTGDALVPDLVRFAHRLGCRVRLVTDGTGMDRALALHLVDRGLAGVRVLVGGVSDEVQQQVVGNTAEQATGAVFALVGARRDRVAPLDVEVATPWLRPADTELRAVFGWAHQAGTQGFVLLAPGRATGLPTEDAVLSWLSEQPAPFNRTMARTLRALRQMAAHEDGEPGIPRGVAAGLEPALRCPMGGQRLEIDLHGNLCCCPFKGPIGHVEGSLPVAWTGAAAHLADIRACSRACVHDELTPRPVVDLAC